MQHLQQSPSAITVILENNHKLLSGWPGEWSIFKGHLPHQRAAVVTSLGVRSFIAVAQDFK